MNKKGAELNYAGLIVITAIAVIIGASLLPTVADYVSLLTNTESAVNVSVTTAANGNYVDLTGKKLIGSYTINNKTHSTGDAGITSSGLSIAEGISSSTGKVRIRMLTSNATWASKTVNVTYVYGNEGYINDSAGRAVALLIILFSALLIMVIAIIPIFRQKVLEMVGVR